MDSSEKSLSKRERGVGLHAVCLLALLALAGCKTGGDNVEASSPSGTSAPAPSPSPSPAPSPSPTPDSTPPNIGITSPTSSSTYTATSASLNIGGTASDNVGVQRVQWSNSLGGSGTASGTTSWSVSGIALQSGSNVITVTAYDTSGLSRSDTITVSFSPSTPPPVPTFNNLEVSWPANADNPDGYHVYMGASSGGATTIARTLNRGDSGWDPASPFTAIPSSTVISIVGSAATQACVRIAAYNGYGQSAPSVASCVPLP